MVIFATLLHYCSQKMKIALQKSDTIGAIASSLCVVHCLVTPLIFIAHSCSLGACDTAPTWWKSIDYLFLLIAFVSVYRSSQTTSKKFMKPLLWGSWSLLFALILNEKIKLFYATETLTYAAAFTLALIHLYNLKYCQCKSDKCCSNE